MATLALAAEAVGAPDVLAGWLGFRNDLSHAIIIRCSSEKAAYLYPGEVRWRWIPDKRTKQITITDARTPRTVLDRIEVTAPPGQEIFYVVQRVNPATDGAKTVEAVRTDPKPASITKK